MMSRIGVFYRNRFRNRLPVTGYNEYNQVRVPTDIAPKRRLGELSVFSRWALNKSIYKGYLQDIRTYVSQRDTVTIIGGGRGISSVVAAQQTGAEGQVLIYEGSPEMINLINKVLDLNGVRKWCTVRQAVVGPGINVYTENDEISSISPTELKDCDVLVLDCEGAEYSVLPELEIQPQYIIVEFHPDKVSRPADAVLSELENYDLVETGTYYGNSVSEQRFRNLLERRKRGEPDVDGSYVKNPIAVLELNC